MFVKKNSSISGNWKNCRFWQQGNSHFHKIAGAHAVVDLNTPLDPVFHMEAVGAINEDVENPVKEMCKKMGELFPITNLRDGLKFSFRNKKIVSHNPAVCSIVLLIENYLVAKRCY